MSRSRLGAWGERLAWLHLAARGYRLVHRGWRCGRLGEIDLILRRGACLVFVEVKTRRGHAHGRPEEAVDRRKQARIVKLAAAFRASLPPDSPLLRLRVRLDVVAIERLGVCAWRLRHLPDAFEERRGTARRSG
ncbi:MAG: YraN family protein [Acidobacteriota bacterium]|jgi:putative endonuclease